MRLPSTAALATLILAAGCGNPELDGLEAKQAELKQQVAELEATIGELQDEMVAAGVITAKQVKPRAAEGGEEGKPKGKRRGKKADDDADPSGALAPANALDWDVTAARTGRPPALPALTDLERTDTPCGYKFVVRDLQPLSDYPLNNAGFGKAGPFLLLEDGEPLVPHATPDQFEDSCSGAFRHAGYGFTFSPNGDVDAAKSRTYALALSPDVPLARGEDGAPVYWIYPGTTLTFTIDGRWDASWGRMAVAVRGRIAKPGEAAATVSFPGVDAEIAPTSKPGPFAIESQATPSGDRWTIEIASPADGPYLVLANVAVGNAEHGLVVASVGGEE